MKLKMLIFCLMINGIYSNDEEAVGAKTFEELVKTGVIRKSVPLEIRAIWHGKLILKPHEGEDQIEILDMCSYPIKTNLKFKNEFSSKYMERFFLSGIREYDRYEYRKANSINIYLYSFDKDSRKLLTGAADFRYYKSKNKITQERYNPDEKEPYWKMEYKREKCPN